MQKNGRFKTFPGKHMKIFHIVENLDKGAVENWLVNVFLESRKHRPDWKWTFFCVLGKEGRLDDVVRKAGGEVIHSPYWLSQKRNFLLNLRSILKKGQYDILHVHHDFQSGFYVPAFLGLRFKRRILHIHNTDKNLPVGNPFIRALLLGPLRFAAVRWADTVVGISRDTLAEFLKGTRGQERKGVVLYYGIDLHKFGNRPAKGWLNDELKIEPGSKVLLFAGRMNELKNPAFVIEVLQELQHYRKDVVAVFVGKGGEEQTVIDKARGYGLEERIRLAGWRDDLSGIMQQSDLFIFPRVEYPKEGLGLVVVEAQSAGLPMALSGGIVEDSIVIAELAHFIALRNNPAQWAAVVNDILERGRRLSQEEALSLMQRSPFSLTNAAQNLISLYEKAS